MKFYELRPCKFRGCKKKVKLDAGQRNLYYCSKHRRRKKVIKKKPQPKSWKCAIHGCANMVVRTGRRGAPRLYCDDHKRAWRRTKKASSTEKARQKYLTNFKNRSRVKPEFSPIAQRSHQHYGVPRGGRWVHPPREDLALQRYSLRKQKRRNPWRGEQRAFAALKIDLLETKNNAKKLLIVYQEIKPLLKRYISANLNFAKLALKHNIRSRWEVKRIQEIAEVKNARNLKEVTWEKLQKKIDALSHLV